MEKIEKMHMMDKMIRELEDISNSQTALLKKVGQLEANNINFGNSLLEKKLPDMYAKIDDGVNDATALHEEFTELRNKFVADNKLEEVLPE